MLRQNLLRRAAQAGVRAKIAGSDEGSGGEQSSFGRIQSGVAAAYLGLPEEAYGRLRVMAVKRSMIASLITSHEPNGEIFNADGNGGIPQIVNTMLLQSRILPQETESRAAKIRAEIILLPALTKAWPAGKVTGLSARGGFEMDCAWQDGRLTEAVIRSKRGGSCRVACRDKHVTIDAVAGRSYRLDGDLNERPAAPSR